MRSSSSRRLPRLARPSSSGSASCAVQTYFGSAHVLAVMAARFERNHWKYNAHDKAYPGDPDGRRASPSDALPRGRRTGPRRIRDSGGQHRRRRRAACSWTAIAEGCWRSAASGHRRRAAALRPTFLPYLPSRGRARARSPARRTGGGRRGLRPRRRASPRPSSWAIARRRRRAPGVQLRQGTPVTDTAWPNRPLLERVLPGGGVDDQQGLDRAPRSRCSITAPDLRPARPSGWSACAGDQPCPRWSSPPAPWAASIASSATAAGSPPFCRPTMSACARSAQISKLLVGGGGGGVSTSSRTTECPARELCSPACRSSSSSPCR